MSLFFGARQKSKPQYSSLQVQSSSNNLPLPLVWGLTRLAPNLIWYGDFKAKKAKAAGKGGGGKGGAQYTYSASVEMALCQGPSDGVIKVYRDNEKNATLSSLGLTFIDGSDPQAPWSYLVASHPEAALSYPGTVIVAKANYDLGNSASLPQHSFETKTLRYNTQVGGAGDADPALCVLDLLTLPVGGCGFSESLIDMNSLMSGPDAPTTGDSAFQTYCQALGLGISPALTSQEQATDVLDRWGKILNTAVIWNGAMLKFIPFGLEEVTGNGVTFVPPNSVGASIYTLTDNDYISGDQGNTVDPIIITRRNPQDQKNRLQMEILNREKEYNAVPIEWVDQALVDQFGNRQDAVFNAHEICEPAIATTCVALMGQRNAYRGANQYKFTLGPEYCLVEPMDVLTLTDPVLGIIDVQIDESEEDEENNITFQASQVLVGSTSSNGFTPPDQTPTGNDTGVPAGDVNAPIFIEPTSLLAGSTAQVWAAVSGVDTVHWGGCFVWVSQDGATFTQIGEIVEPARMGVTTSALAAYAGTNPDTAHTVGVDLSESAGELISVAAGDAATYATLSYVGGELISYQDALLTSTSHYTLQTALYRGLYGTAAAGAAIGAPFARLDDAIFKYTLPTQYIDKTLYFKFQSYNVFGGAVQDLSTCAVYVYSPAGTGYGTGPGGTPTTAGTPSVSAGPGFNQITWTTNPDQDNVKEYKIYRATGTGAAFGSATEIGTSTGSSYTDATASPGTSYTYFVVANNQVGDGVNSGGTSITSSAATNKFGFAFQRDIANVVVSKPFAFFDTPASISWTLPAGLPDCAGRIAGDGATAPTAQTDFDIQTPAGTSVGTMRFAASSLTATFIKASSTAIAGGSPVQLVAPANLNGMGGTIFASIVGTK